MFVYYLLYDGKVHRDEINQLIEQLRTGLVQPEELTESEVKAVLAATNGVNPLPADAIRTLRRSMTVFVAEGR
jgi:hypothetical protein